MNKKLFITILAFNVFYFFVYTHTADAVSLFPEQLVPCDGPDCDLSSLATGLGRLMKFLIAIVVTGSVLVFAWVGIKYMMNQGDASKVKSAHEIFKHVAIGLALVLGAWLIVSTLLSLLTDKNLDEYRDEYLIKN